MIKRVTHTHLGPIWHHSKPSDVPYSPNRFLCWDFICRFLQQDGSKCLAFIPNTIYCTSAQLANACYLQCLTKIEKMLLNNLLCPTIDDTGWGKADFICNFSRQIEFKIEMCREFQFLIHCLPLHHKMLLRRSSYQIFIHPYWNIWVDGGGDNPWIVELLSWA